jgi:hypothetical protein
MKTRKILFASIFVLILLPIGIDLSYASQSSVSGMAQVPPALPMTLTTDKISYSDGDKITVSGTVRDPMIGAAVTITIRSPNNNVVLIGQSLISDNNAFSTTFTTGGSLWQDAGKYEIVAKIGNKDAVTTFQFNGYVPFESIHVDGTDLNVLYKIVGGQLLKISPNVQSKSLVLSIKAISDGSLTIVLPRSLIDSQSNGNDIPFSVMVDGKVVEHTEQSSSHDRTLVIPFGKGSSEIIISGTRVIPEFGPVAGLIFAITILSVLMVFSKTNTKLIGLRY